MQRFVILPWGAQLRQLLLCALAAVAGPGCFTRYRPVRPSAGQVDDLRVEVKEITGGGDIVIRAATRAGARVRHVFLASSQTSPCSGGAELVAAGVGGPFKEVDLRGETVLTLFAMGTPPDLLRKGANLDLSLGQDAGGCVRVPITGDESETRWVSNRGWSLVGTLAVAPRFAPGRNTGAWTISLAPRLWLGRIQVGGAYQFGTLLCDADCRQAVLVAGPMTGARLLRTRWWAIDADVAYEVGGIQSVGFVHGPRVSLSVLKSKRSRTAMFNPELFFAAFGVELAAGYWFRGNGPAATAPWYFALGPTVSLGL